MYIRLILEICFCLTVVTAASKLSCDYRQEVQPVEIFNSKYSFVNGTQLCCPPVSDCDFSPEDMNCTCLHGLVKDPCLQCHICGKTLGEECGGPYGIYGVCIEEYVCSADEKIFDRGANISGVCKYKELRKEHETCDEINNCKEGLVCRKVVEQYICIKNDTKLSAVCNKTCTDHGGNPKCGSDGRVYDNLCYLRQERCLGHHLQKIDCPEQYCQPIEAPVNGSIKYSDQLTIDRIECKPGFEPVYDEHPDIYVDFPASFKCVCSKSKDCKWFYGPNNDKEVTFEDLPRCVNTRERNCQKRAAEKADDTPQRVIKNENQSNLAA